MSWGLDTDCMSENSANIVSCLLAGCHNEAQFIQTLYKSLSSH